MVSTPQPMVVSAAPAEMRLAAMWFACCDEPHWQSMVVAATSYGSPANSHDVRVTLKPCSPAWVTHPPMTCSTDAGSMPARLTTSTCAAPRMSGARRPESQPLRFPIGVRTASMITGCAMAHFLLAGGPPPAAPRPAGSAGLRRRFLEPVLTLAPAHRSLPWPDRRAPDARPPNLARPLSLSSPGAPRSRVANISWSRTGVWGPAPTRA